MAVSAVRRSDFNQSLIHLTRNRSEFEKLRDGSLGKLNRTVSAFEVLKEIISSATLRASGNEGYVKGMKKAVCFSEIPLSAVHEFATPPSDPTNRYRYYGIAFSKRAIFDLGGRPVIYIPDGEAQWIPEDQKWRQVRFEHGSVDYTHEREWRVQGDVNLTKVPGLYLIVWSATEAKELAVFKSPIDKLVRGILPMEHITTML
jgi:hypothetical protein